MKLKDFQANISVPDRIKGLHRTADYICRNQAERFAKAVTPKRPLLTYYIRRKTNEDNWFDSHIDVITELLLDLREKLRDKYK